MKGCGCGISSYSAPKPVPKTPEEPVYQEKTEEPPITRRKRKVYKPRKRKTNVPQIKYVEPPQPEKKLSVNESGNNYLTTTKIYKPLPNFVLKKPKYV